ncbi:hypothetical protein H072_7022 [Dactylellina haptotyla CBS 200.50]|uniref:DUF7719 domain-containing protein n=1 Tax=Dactylellina haptotyla (strain CBS 200.50) TaxID=1284197 RepID=S8BV67_DACHA|nr:hypothetical protein H072_7022 [Dactylellina haptotyla CBS 200.50]
MPRQRKNQKVKASQVDSDSEIEEIPRKTLFEHIGSNMPEFQQGAPFNINDLNTPLAEALENSGKKEGITYESYNIPAAQPKRTHPKAPPKHKGAEEEEDEVEVFGDAAQTFFFSIPLLLLLGGFYVLVQAQYLEETSYPEIISRTLKSFPAIWMTLYVTHPRRDWKIVQFAFVCTAISTGCWVVYNVNHHGYYKIMKMVPPLGTLLIYSVIQMDLAPSVLSLAAIGFYTWYYDFSIFTV